MSNGGDWGDPEPKPGPSGLRRLPKLEPISDDDSSTSESEIGAFSENYNPMKALYSEKIVLPVPNAPIYENLQQFESALTRTNEILAVGMGQQVKEREAQKIQQKLAYEKAIEEKNKQRFAKYTAPVKVDRKVGRNVLTREETITGPLGALRHCMGNGLRVKVVTRGPKGVRGELHANVSAFDKHWNLVLTNVLEVYRKKASKKRKIPPTGGRPVPKGTANMISPIPTEVETPIGDRVWECVRHIPQLLVRGEHVVLINIVVQ